MRRQACPVSQGQSEQEACPLSLRERVRVRGQRKAPLPRQVLHASACIIVLLLTPVARAQEGDANRALAECAVAILRQYCYRCHGQEFKVEGYNVLDRSVLVAKREGEDPYITPGKLDASELWARFDEMPPKGAKPKADEKDVIRRWIVSGAPFPTAAAREFVADRAVLAAIREHLRGLDRADRPFQRYVTLTNLHNSDPNRVTDEDLRWA